MTIGSAVIATGAPATTVNALQPGQSLVTGPTGVVPAIATGGAHTCALLNTGQISCWGRNTSGELGTGNTTDLSAPSAPIALPAGTTATAIDAGGAHTCALLNTGQISCWGGNGSGQLGTGDITNLSTPSAPIALPAGTTATAIAAGGAQTCALLNTGQISCWGDNFFGQLGTGTTTNLSTPSAPIALPAGTTATAIAAGSRQTCALLNTGQISCWGFGAFGALGTGTTTSLSAPSAPIALPAGTTATAIASGSSHTCALLNTGQISCWGFGGSGALGTGTTTNLSAPSPPITLATGTTATAIDTGDAHTCALLNTGQISCWGRNVEGRLGTGATTDLNAPSPPITLPTSTTATAIATGTFHTCALLNTGRISCWGGNGFGQLGTGTTTDLNTPSAPITLPTVTTATAIATGGAHTCALLNTGQISCWGFNGSGQLGTGTTTLFAPSSPITLPGGTTATAIATGTFHSCALLNTGQISCWGRSDFGQLGTGTTTNLNTPSAPISLPPGTTATAVTAARNHTCALLNTGQISCWGRGDFGQLGTGTTTDLYAPSPPITLPPGTTATGIATGVEHSCALLNTGQITCWGINGSGQLGTGTTGGIVNPPSFSITLPGGTTATGIATGGAHTCALLNTGQISCWGFGGDGQLGTGDTTDLSTPSAPISLPTGTTATGIATGGAHTCALLNTGQISCWGINGSGQLGTGTTGGIVNTPSAPITLPAGTTATGIATGNNHTCAVLNTGQISCWGSNLIGELGTSGNTSSSPVLSGVPAVSVALAATQASPTNVSPVEFTITFDQDVTGFDATDLTVSGTAGATTATLTGGPRVFTASVTPTAAGTVDVTVPADVATSLLGSTNTPSNTATVDYQTAPAAPTAVTAAAGNQTATVTWTAPTTTGGATITGYQIEQSADNGTTWNPTVTSPDATTSPAVTATVTGLTNGTAYQFRVSAINTVGTSVPSNASDPVTPTTAPTVAVTLAAGQATPTNTSPVVFTVTFDQPVSGFDLAGLTIAGTATIGTATLTDDTTTGGPSTYTITIPATSDGTITVQVPAGAATNTPNNQPNTASNTATVTHDTVGPTINTPTGGVVRANTDPGRPGATVTYTVTADDPTPTQPQSLTLDTTPRVDRLQTAGLVATLTCTPASGSFFPIGTTTVTCTATDTATNTTTTTFAVTITDNEAPVITGGNQTFTLPTGVTTGPIAYIVPTATDNSGTATITCTPPPGAAFTAGATTITCTATDPSNNTATATYTINTTATPPTLQPPAPPTPPPTPAPPAPVEPPLGGLPETGNNPNSLLTLALGLLTLGALTLATTRRRAHH